MMEKEDKIVSMDITSLSLLQQRGEVHGFTCSRERALGIRTKKGGIGHDGKGRKNNVNGHYLHVPTAAAVLQAYAGDYRCLVSVEIDLVAII
jgi:hypothetical protein